MRVDHRVETPRASFAPTGLGRDACVEPSGIRHPASFICSFENAEGDIVDFGCILNVRDKEWLFDFWGEGEFYGTLTECFEKAVSSAESLVNA